MTPAVNQLATLLSELAKLPQLATQAALEAQGFQDLLHSQKNLERLPLLVTDRMVEAFNSCTPDDSLPLREIHRQKIAAALGTAKTSPNQVLPEGWNLRITAKDNLFVFQIISPLADDIENIPAESKEIPGVLTLGVPRDGSSPSRIVASLQDALAAHDKQSGVGRE